MKKLYTNRFAALLSLLLFSITLSLSAKEVRKDYHREMVPAENSTLTVINKYGAVVTETWERDLIVIDVEVKVESWSEEQAIKQLEMIRVEFTESGGNLKAETIISSDFSSSLRWGRSSRNNFSINYNIKMPSQVNIDLSNKYGNVSIDKITALATINIKYGNLTVNNLTRGNETPVNSITLAYGNATIGELGWASINARYAGMITIEKARALTVDTKYSKLSVNEVNSLVSDSKYDGYTIGRVRNIVFSGAYTNMNFKRVDSRLEVETKYGNLTVDQIPSHFESLIVRSGYCSVKLGIDKSSCYQLNASSSYGGIRYDKENFTSVRYIAGNNSTTLEGKVGNCTSPRSEVNIKASYGSVLLY